MIHKVYLAQSHPDTCPGACVCVCVHAWASTLTGHGQAAAPGPALILTQLPVHFGLGGGSGGGRQVGITQLPEEERRWSSKLLLEGCRRTDERPSRTSR